MIKKTTLILILGFILIITAFSLEGDEKEEPWVTHLIQQAAPNSRLPGSSVFGEIASAENYELSLLAIHNINVHLMEVAKLRAKGWSESEIAAQFEQGLSHDQIGTGAIAGKLTEKGGGVIKHYASVYAFNEFGHYCGYGSPGGFSNGNYLIENLHPGKYYVRVSSSYYETQYYRNATDWKKAKKVRVNKYKTKRNINFKLKITRKTEGKGAISGQVKGKDGTPLLDCYISVYNLDNRFVKSTKTDANGQYVVAAIPSGKYKVACYFSQSKASMTSWYQNARTIDDASIVTVTEPETTPNINFVLELGGIIKVKVLGSDGKLAYAYNCNVVAYDMKQNMVRYGSRDDKGKFIVGFLPKGRYKLHVRYNGTENNVNSWYKKAKKFKSATPIQVNSQQTKNVTVKLNRGGMIKGRVTGSNGQPITLPCAVEAYDDNGMYIKRGHTDVSGVFWIRGLETGRYKLYADIDDYPTEGSPQPVSEWYNHKKSFRDAVFIKVKAPKTTSNVNFSLPHGGYITCRVLGPYGYNLSPDVSVSAYNSMFERVGYAYYAGYDGRFALNGLPSGNYRVRAWYHGDEDYLSEFYDNKLLIETAQDITVTAPNGTGNITIELDHPGVLQGFLTDSKKKRVIDEENYAIPIYAFDEETGEFSGSTTNTLMSGYHLELLEGKYKLAAYSVYYNWMTAADDFGVTWHPNGKKFNDPATKVHSAKSGSAKKLMSLSLKKLKGAISGTFYDKASGLAQTKGLYMVWVFDSDGFLASLSGYLDSNNPIYGDYRVGGLRPGNYYVLVTAFNDFSDPDNIPVEWYGGVKVPWEELWYKLTPKVEIPAGASPVSVGTGPTSGIDFYLDIEK